MKKVIISGYSKNEGTREFEILDRKQIEDAIDELSTSQIYTDTFKKAASYSATGKVFTYINVMNGQVSTMWMQNNHQEHPWDSFYEIVLCSADSGNGNTEFDSQTMLDDDEQKEFRNFEGSLEEFLGDEYSGRFEDCIDYQAGEFELNWDNINQQLDDLYGRTDHEILIDEVDLVECTVYASNGNSEIWVWSIDHESGHDTFISAEKALQDLKNWVREQETSLSEENIQKIMDYKI